MKFFNKLYNLIGILVGSILLLSIGVAYSQDTLRDHIGQADGDDTYIRVKTTYNGLTAKNQNKQSPNQSQKKDDDIDVDSILTVNRGFGDFNFEGFGYLPNAKEYAEIENKMKQILKQSIPIILTMPVVIPKVTPGDVLTAYKYFVENYNPRDFDNMRFLFAPTDKGMFIQDEKYASSYYEISSTGGSNGNDIIYFALKPNANSYFNTDELSVMAIHNYALMKLTGTGISKEAINALATSLHEHLSIILFSKPNVVDSKFQNVKSSIASGEEYGSTEEGVINVGNKTIELKEGNLTAFDVDAIVNGSNPGLLFGIGVGEAILRYGGNSIAEEAANIVKRQGYLTPGDAVVTSAGTLKAKHVIHAAVSNMDLEPDLSVIREATESSLKVADELGLKSIAFPAFGTGIIGIPYEESAKVMLEIIEKHLKGNTSLEKVNLVYYGEDAYKAALAAVPKEKPQEIADFSLVAPRNTAKETEVDPLNFLSRAMEVGARDAISGMEKEGQESFVGSDTLPIDFGYSEYDDKAILEAAGVKFYGAVEGDSLFQYVELPKGWKKVPGEHPMYSYLIDEKGRERASIFYKAEFYDRKANINVVSRFRCELDYDRLNSDKVAVAYVFDRDGDKVIYATNPIKFELDDAKYENRDKAKQTALTWLNDKYPDWKNPGAYWDNLDTLTTETTDSLTIEALLKLDWIEEIAEFESGTSFTLNKDNINIIGVNGDSKDCTLENITAKLQELKPKQVLSIMVTNPDRKEALEKEFAGILGDKVFITELENESAAEWNNLIEEQKNLTGEDLFYDFREQIDVPKINKNTNLIQKLA